MMIALVLGGLIIWHAFPAAAEEITERDEIRRVQEALQLFGPELGRADGVLGPKTRAAVRRFEQAAGLPVDGQLDRATIAAVHLARERIAALTVDSDVMTWEGATFTLEDVERHCQVLRWNEDAGELECRVPGWGREVQNCEVAFVVGDEEVGELFCRVEELALIEERCQAVVERGEEYGELRC